MTAGRRHRWWWMRGLGLAIAALLLLPLPGASPAVAQESRLQINSASADDWPSVEATLTVLDGDGQPVSGLTREDFGAALDGREITVGTVQTTSDPGVGIAVVLAFDLSGSMEGAPLEQAKIAGRALIDQLGPDDQAAIVTFASDVVVAQSFTSDRALLSAAVDGLQAAGNTALYGGVHRSAQLAGEAPLERSAIVLLSDGVDFGGVSDAGRAESLEGVRAGRSIVVAVGLGSQLDDAYLASLSEAGGGQFLRAPAPADLTAAYLAAGNLLRQQYILTLDAGDLDPAGETAQLEVRALVGGAEASATTPVSVPAGVVAPDEPVVTVPPAAEPVPEAEPLPGAAETSSGTPLAVILGPLAAAVLAAGGGLILLRRRRTAPPPEPAWVDAGRKPQPVSFPTIQRAAEAEAGAWLEGGDLGRLPIGESPVTVGFSPDCTHVLANGTGSHHERVRVWYRDGRYMLHNLTRLGDVRVGGRPVTWVILEEGDEVDVGGVRLTFRLGDPA